MGGVRSGRPKMTLARDRVERDFLAAVPMRFFDWGAAHQHPGGWEGVVASTIGHEALRGARRLGGTSDARWR